METREIVELFQGLATPHVADACLRCGVQVRCAPYELQPVYRSSHVAGKVRPARHYGSVDIFLEALEMASPGEVLVVDNAGRRDEACVGDLIALETQMAGLAGIVIWGLHRDTPEILQIGLPVFSLGACPTGPLRLDPGGLRQVEATSLQVSAPDRVHPASPHRGAGEPIPPAHLSGGAPYFAGCKSP